MSNQHVLKIHPAPLADLLSGAKTAEVRRNDRGFQVGDTVRLMEVNPETLNWTGRPDLVRTISHIQTGYGLPDGLCVLSYADTAQRDALARVEAERDGVQIDAMTYAEQRDTAQAQLAEAIKLLGWSKYQLMLWEDYQVENGFEVEDHYVTGKVREEVEAFLARHAQAERQEAPKRGKPDWNSHSYDQMFQTSDGNWFGARADWDFKAHISDGWKGREVSLLRDDGGFLAYGEQNPDWENSLEQRPVQEAQGAQAGEFQRERRYMVIKLNKLADDQGANMSRREQIFRIAHFGRAMVECVVVESDWPEYEPTWAAIQARVECGKRGNDHDQ